MDQRVEGRGQVDEALVPHVQGKPDADMTISPGLQSRELIALSGFVLGEIAQWSLTMQRERLMKTVAKIIRHTKHPTFQFDEISEPGKLFTVIDERFTCIAITPSNVVRKYDYKYQPPKKSI